MTPALVACMKLSQSSMEPIMYASLVLLLMLNAYLD